MSVWSTVSTLGQMVQGTLEQALGDEDEAKKKEEDIGSAPMDTPSLISHDLLEEGDVEKMRERLKEIEAQNQLINNEYAKLLRDKEEELVRLRSGQGEGGEAELARLRNLLEAKELELKELNTKAETKFNKLKTQAKTKIVNLQEELQKLREDKSVVVANTSQESLNLSIQSIDNSSEVNRLQESLSVLRDTLSEKEAEIVKLNEFLCSRDTQLEEKKSELVEKEAELAKNKVELVGKETELTERESNLRILQEKGEKLRGEISQLTTKLTMAESEIDNQTSTLNDFTATVAELNSTLRTQSETLERDSAFQNQLKLEVEKEREERARLAQQVTELVHKMEEDKRITRDLSFASSEFQIVSQIDSEEEWKIVRTSESGSGSSEGKETSPPPEILSIAPERPSTESPAHQLSPKAMAELQSVLASKEAEIALLKGHITEYDNKLAVMTEKVTSLENEKEANQWGVTDSTWGFDEPDKSEEISELKEIVGKLTNEVVRTREECSQKTDLLESQAKEVSLENDNQKDTIEELKNTLDSNETEIANSNVKVSDMTEIITRLEQDLANTNIRMERLEKEKSDLLVKHSTDLSQAQTNQDTQLKLDNALEEVEALTISVNEGKEKIELILKEKEELANMLESEQEIVRCLKEKEEKESERFSREFKEKLSKGLNEKDEMIETLTKERDSLTQELKGCRSEVRALEEFRERKETDQSKLKEEVKRLSSSNDTFSSDSAKCREDIMSLETQVGQLKRDNTRLTSELDTSTATIRRLEKQAKTNEGKDAELQKYKQETGRLKDQFDSAVELLQQENTQLKSDLAGSKRECSQRASACDALQEQVKSEGARTMQLKEMNKGLSQEIKGLNERYMALERERDSLNHRLLQLTRDHEQVQVSLEASLTEQEALTRENDSTRKSNEVYEKHVLELTNQITVLVREKDTLEESVRKLQREAVVREREGDELKERLELIERNASGQSEWPKEREALLNTQSELQSELSFIKREKREKEVAIDTLNKTTQDLQVQCGTLQDALVSAKGVMSESTKKEINRIVELEKRISDMKYAHDIELSSVRSSLEDEKHTRTTLEQNLNLQQQHELTIDIEDDSRDEEEVGGADFTAVKKLFRRFVKKPNIVLMRLVRATPQTQLFFIAYLLVIHILLMYMTLR